MTQKEEWAKAYRETGLQYKKGIHRNIPIVCPKCKLSGDIELTGIKITQNCKACPEDIFTLPNNECYGCLYRLTPAMDSDAITFNTTENASNIVKRLVEYHEQAALYIENLPEFDLQSIQEFLVKLDKDLYFYE